MSFLSVLFLFILGYCSFNHAQQPYYDYSKKNCSFEKNNFALGYSCNGPKTSCLTYLIFRSKPPYNNVSAISDLLGSDPSQLSEINSVSLNATFQTYKLVIAPVTCSCSGPYYQSNTSYLFQPENPLYSTAYNLLESIADNIFQGLSTCQAIVQNEIGKGVSISFNYSMIIPLRCGCPTKSQADSGINYLLSYPVTQGETVSDIAARFGADPMTTLLANKLTPKHKINPLTTVLVPLEHPPNSSQTVLLSPPSTTPEPNRSSNKTWIFVVIAFIGGILFVLVSGAIIFVAFFYRCDTNSNPVNVSETSDGGPQAEPLRIYEFDELQAATNNFNSSCHIEGSVYCGSFNGNHSAIKKMNGDVAEGLELLEGLNHCNLIRLQGVCLNEGIYYLVYEYAANGSLSDWIYSSNNSARFLNWNQRVQIALDGSRGLKYLHRLSVPRAHKNINSSNVFLDSNLRAKIGNFSMTRSTNGEETCLKDDVYAFGILMLEIITGKELMPLQTHENMNLFDMLSYLVQEEVENDWLNQIIDHSMDGNYPPEQARALVRLIYSCLSKSPAVRPSMNELERDLSRIFCNSLIELSNLSGYQSSGVSISERSERWV